MRVAQGTYTGDGTNNRAITGLGFAPKFVVVKPNLGGLGWAKISTIDGAQADRSFSLADNADLGSTNNDNMIDSCDADGFTISYSIIYGADNSTNKSGATYYYLAIGGDDVVAGKYTGNGSDNRSITGVGFKPGFVIVKGSNNDYVGMKMKSMAGDLAGNFYETLMTNVIQAFEADGFQIGTDAVVNTNGVTYWYVAVNEDATGFFSGTYTGNATDDRDISGVGFQPDAVLIKGNFAGYGYHTYKTASMTGDNSLDFRLATLTANWVQSLGADGFQVGSATNANANSINEYYVAFKDSPAVAGSTSDFFNLF